MSQLRELAEEECELTMTPMIDVTFLLLIFFMCTIKFKTLEGKLAANLPKDVGVNTSEAEPVEKVDIKLILEKEGTKVHPRREGMAWIGQGAFRYGDDRVVKYVIGPFETRKLSEVVKRLEELHRADEDRGSTIDARKDIVYSDVVKVLDAAIDVGFKEVTFVGSHE